MERARALWAEGSPEDWREALARYASVVAERGTDRLPELDAWYREELPRLLSERDPAYIEKTELLDIIRWKMKRGTWRARNLALAAGNDEAAVRHASARAFERAPEPDALTPLCELAGVGPATASAVLAAYRPDAYPFLDEDVGAALPELGAPAFTAGYYRRYAAALRTKATELGSPWQAQAVGLALWAAAKGAGTP